MVACVILKIITSKCGGCCLFERSVLITVILYCISYEFVWRQPVDICSSSARLKGFLLTGIFCLRRYLNTVITSPLFLLQTWSDQVGQTTLKTFAEAWNTSIYIFFFTAQPTSFWVLVKMKILQTYSSYCHQHLVRRTCTSYLCLVHRQHKTFFLFFFPLYF